MKPQGTFSLKKKHRKNKCAQENIQNKRTLSDAAVENEMTKNHMQEVRMLSNEHRKKNKKT